MKPQNVHILNGDALAEQLDAAGMIEPVIIWREIMVEGPITAESPKALFSLRKAYLDQTYPDPDRTYDSVLLPEMEKVISLPENSSVYLWFEDDLFCQVNMWAVLWLLTNRTDLNIYRVFPVETEAEYRWMGFGANQPDDLPLALKKAVPLTQLEVELGMGLWKAFVEKDADMLTRLSAHDSVAFRDLKEVVEAWMEHPQRIQATMRQLLDSGVTEFGPVFRAVWKEHGIYGFGDLQIKRLFDEMTS